MKKIISISEVVGSHETEGGNAEVCAGAEAAFDEAKSQVIVDLESYIRTSDLRGSEQRSTPDWLPHRETIKETVPLEEAALMAKEIFQRWVKKVRQSAPSFIHH